MLAVLRITGAWVNPNGTTFFTEAMGLASIADAKVAYENTNLAARMSKYHKNPDNTFYGWNDSWLHTDFKNWNITDVIDYIRIPVLAIQGREDQYGTTAQIEALEAQLYAPLDIELLEDCKHSPFLEQPDLTLGSINNFAQDCTRSKLRSPPPDKTTKL